jgi:hypothetical protein
MARFLCCTFSCWAAWLGPCLDSLTQLKTGYGIYAGDGASHVTTTPIMCPVTAADALDHDLTIAHLVRVFVVTLPGDPSLAQLDGLRWVFVMNA